MTVTEQATASRTEGGAVATLRSWYREPAVSATPGPNRLDALLVVAGTIGAVVETIFRPDVTWRAAALLVALGTVALLPWRRRHGLRTTAIAFGGITVFTVLSAAETEPFGLYAMVLLLLIPAALFRWSSGRDATIGLACCVVTWLVSTIADFTTVGEAIGGLVFLLLPIAFGALARSRAVVREERQRRIRSNEREQLARELHDTVAHHMSAVAVQAQAGQALAAARPEAAVEALAVIEAAASRSLTELRDMVRTLRTDGSAFGTDGSSPLTPQAGLEELERLGEQPGGLAVTVDIDGPRHAVPPAVAGALHRVAQESLTNVIRHANGATRADVCVRVNAPFTIDPHDPATSHPPTVVLTVDDDGQSGASTSTVGGGFGLIGMRERADLLGGTLSAGPSPSGGWSVRCELPLGGRP